MNYKELEGTGHDAIQTVLRDLYGWVLKTK